MPPDLLRTLKPEANVEALKKARNSFRFTRSVVRELNLSLIINFVISHNLTQCLLEELHELDGVDWSKNIERYACSKPRYSNGMRLSILTGVCPLGYSGKICILSSFLRSCKKPGRRGW